MRRLRSSGLWGIHARRELLISIFIWRVWLPCRGSEDCCQPLHETRRPDGIDGMFYGDLRHFGVDLRCERLVVGKGIGKDARNDGGRQQPEYHNDNNTAGTE